MAVSVQASHHSTLSMWHYSQPPLAFSSQFPVTQSGEFYSAPTLEPSSVVPMYHQALMNDEPKDTIGHLPQSVEQRGPTIGSKGEKLERSSSTPNVRTQANIDAAALALSADKRRNKLGYHRTSVACGHCRRRKIRCIPAPGDHQNRCSNCIRLKKECNFFPVDQQPAIEPRRRSSKTHGTAPSETSQASSPSKGHAPVFENQAMKSSLRNHGGLAMQDSGSSSTKRHRSESMSPENEAVTFPRVSEYAPASRDWVPSQLSPTSKVDSGGSQRLWRDANETTMGGGFPSSTLSMPQTEWSHADPQLLAKNDLQWSVPSRSSSYNNLDRLSIQLGGPFDQTYSSNSQYAAKPRMVPSMFSPSAPTSTTDMATVQRPVPEEQLSGSMPQYSSWQQPYPYLNSASSNTNSYGTWHFGHEGSLPPPSATGHSGVPQYSQDEQERARYFANHGHNT